MVQRIDRHSEHHFASLCVAAGAACNKSEDDRHGWDHIIEIPLNPHPTHPPDRQPQLVTVFVQVKSTQTNTLTTRIKLSNALKAVQSDLPYFIVMFSYSGSETRVYAKHVWLVLTERILKRVRQSEKRGLDSLHKQRFSVSFKAGDQIEESIIVKWIQNTVAAIGEDYASKKIQMRTTCGYDKRRYIGKFTLGPLQNVQQIVDHEIGLLESLPVTDFVVHEKRFGIQSAHPEISSPKGRVQLQKAGARNAILVISNRSGDKVEFSANVRLPSLIPVDHEAFKVRVQAGVLDFTFSPGRNQTQKFQLSYDDRAEYCLYDQSQFFDFIQWCKEGDVDLRLVSEKGVLWGAKVQIGHAVKDWQISDLRSYLKLLLNIGGDTQSRKILTTGRAIQDSMKSGYLIAMLADAHDLRIGTSTSVSEPEVSTFSGFGLIRLGNWHFTSILEFQVINVSRGPEFTAWDLQFSKFLMNSASLVEFEHAKATVKAAFDQHVESSGSRMMYFEDGDLKHFANLGNSETTMRTNK